MLRYDGCQVQKVRDISRLRHFLFVQIGDMMQKIKAATNAFRRTKNQQVEYAAAGIVSNSCSKKLPRSVVIQKGRKNRLCMSAARRAVQLN